MGKAGEFEVAGLADADEEDAFAVLEDDVAGVDDLVVDLIAERAGAVIRLHHFNKMLPFGAP